MTNNGQSGRDQALNTYFLMSAGAVLGATGLAKLFTASGPTRILDAPEPVFGITFRQLLLLVGLGELLIAYFCVFTDRQRLGLLAVAWISTNFVLYRLAIWFSGWQGPCHCMGSLTDVLHIPPGAANNIMMGVLACLLLGSYAILFRQWKRGRRPVAPPPVSA
jgi:hypothetical protein